MAGKLKATIQRFVNHYGYQIRRIDQDVNLVDAYNEQERILGKDAHTIVEIGAFDGRDSLRYASIFPCARIFAFEPVPESFEKLISKTAEHSHITAFNLAISNKQGHAKFYLSNWVDASSLLKPKSTGSTFDAYQASSKSISVQVDTLDAICAREKISHINLLKMDAQGAELQILEGAAEMFSRGSVDMVYSEVHFLESYEGAARFDQVMEFLHQHGLHIHSLYDINHNHRGQMTWCDALFIHSRISY